MIWLLLGRLITAPIEIISFRCAFWRQKADVRLILGVTYIITQTSHLNKCLCTLKIQ